MKLVAFLLPASFFIISCTHSAKSHVTATSLPYTSYHDKVFFSAQPQGLDLKYFAATHNISVVLNLRNQDEIDKLKFDPKNDATKLNLTYYNLPLLKDGEITNETAAAIETAFMKHHKKGEKVLVYCSSGNRAAAWFGTHYAVNHKTNIEKAVKGAKNVGMNKPKMERKLRAYLETLESNHIH